MVVQGSNAMLVFKKKLHPFRLKFLVLSAFLVLQASVLFLPLQTRKRNLMLTLLLNLLINHQ